MKSLFLALALRVESLASALALRVESLALALRLVSLTPSLGSRQVSNRKYYSVFNLCATVLDKQHIAITDASTFDAVKVL